MITRIKVGLILGLHGQGNYQGLPTCNIEYFPTIRLRDYPGIGLSDSQIPKMPRDGCLILPKSGASDKVTILIRLLFTSASSDCHCLHFCQPKPSAGFL